tara:strand:+ start:172 stop:744 length:573 start_codon:yes stop_codon:yes gene_type:complete
MKKGVDTLLGIFVECVYRKQTAKRNSNKLKQTNTMIIKAETLRNLDANVDASELILGELTSYRKSNKLNGYAVVYEDSVDFFNRKSGALLNGIYDLVSWVKVNGGELCIFTNANGEAAIKFQDESEEDEILVETEANNIKGRELLRKSEAMRENASNNRGWNADRRARVERLMIGRADALHTKALKLMSR